MWLDRAWSCPFEETQAQALFKGTIHSLTHSLSLFLFRWDPSLGSWCWCLSFVLSPLVKKSWAHWLGAQKKSSKHGRIVDRIKILKIARNGGTNPNLCKTVNILTSPHAPQSQEITAKKYQKKNPRVFPQTGRQKPWQIRIVPNPKKKTIFVSFPY